MDSFESFLLRPDGLRAAVASVEREMDKLAIESTNSGGAAALPLLAAWRELVKKLDLGPPPELRSCPVCGQTGMRAATRCGHCWSTLEPLAGQGAGAVDATKTS
jgi:hypothetical protein